MKKTILIIWGVTSVFLFGMVSTAFAGRIITVDDDGPAHFNNIQAAIDDCNDGDTVIVADGIYAGAGNRDIDFKRKAITVKSENGPENCIIDCENSGRGFYFHSGEDANSVLDGFTITNGYEWKGGGIYCRYSSPMITNCVISDNTVSRYGGGIYCSWSSAAISNCAVIGNHSLDGGGIYNGVTWSTVENCVIRGNTASRRGGGIYNSDGGRKISNCTINGNTASENGGGMYDYRSGLILNNCTFSGNVANENGGGVYNYDSWPDLSTCMFNGNVANENGGGMYNYDSRLDLSNCMFSGNTASGNGGGMYNFDSKPKLGNCALSSNAAGNAGGGIYVKYSSETSLANCILWGNADSNSTGESAQIGGGTLEVTFSCIQDDDSNDANIPFDSENSDNIDDNPMFVREPNDGGDGWGVGDNDDFGDLHLQDGSPCINTGDPLIWFSPNSVDIDGEPRVMGGIVDMGVDEFFMRMIAVTKPEGGEVWAGDSTHEILWESHLFEGTVDILFSEDGGSNWEVVESDMVDSGSYMWWLPRKVHSNRCLVSVVPSVPDPNVLCVESWVFTIQHYPRRPPAPRGRITRWDKFRRTGLSEYDGPELGCVNWQFETDRPVSASVTVSDDNRVYIACEDGNLYTLDANGSLLWSYDANSPLLSSSALGYYGMIYVGGKDGKLHAIDGGGNVRWTYKTNGPIYSSPAVSADGKIYVCSQDGKLYALGHDGSELWTFETDGFGVAGGSIFASPAVGADGTVYIGGLYDPNLYAINPDDGSVKWACNFESGGWPFTSPAVAADGTIYQTLLYDSNLYAIDPNDGSIIWASNMTDEESGWFEDIVTVYFPDCSYMYIGSGMYAPYDYHYWNFRDFCLVWYYMPPADTSWSKPALGPDGTIYVSFDDPYLRAVDQNGSIKWVTRLNLVGSFTLTVGSNGLIYATSDYGYLSVVNPEGKEIGQFQTDEWLTFTTISADRTAVVSDSRDNTMYITDANNTVWAITQRGCQGQVSALRLFEDLDADGAVNFRDVALLADDWLNSTDPFYTGCRRGRCGTYLTGDVNKDLYVNLEDLAVLTDVWLSGYLDE